MTEVPSTYWTVVRECDRCHEVKTCTWDTDPFLRDVHQQERWAWWCDDCFNYRADDI